MSIWKLRNWVIDPDFPKQEQLENLRYYKYAATDKSLLTKYVLRHYWNACVNLFPRWMAYVVIDTISCVNIYGYYTD